MANFNHFVDNLRSKYFEVRTLEKRSDEMMKQVIDTFYLMEGLNRLQTDLDCLDLLINNNNYLERMLKFKIEAQQKGYKNKLKNFVDRSVKAVTSLQIYRQLVGKTPHKRMESARSQLKRITYTQHAKISELMKMVQSTIVGNFEVLEQLQQIDGMHHNNVEPWGKVQFMEGVVAPTKNQTQPCNGSNGVENNEPQNELFDGNLCKSCESLSVLGRATHSAHICKMCRTVSLPFYQPNRMFSKPRYEGEGSMSLKGMSEVELTIGDGQNLEDLENKDAQSVSSKCKESAFSPRKSVENLATCSHLKGDFVENKFEEVMVNTKEKKIKVIDTEGV